MYGVLPRRKEPIAATATTAAAGSSGSSGGVDHQLFPSGSASSSAVANKSGHVFPASMSGGTRIAKGFRSFSSATSSSNSPSASSTSSSSSLLSTSSSSSSSPKMTTTTTATSKGGEDFVKLFSCAVLPPQAHPDIGKLTVVLDVDETLIHARLPEDTYRQEEDRQDISKTSNFDGETFEITLRPGESFTVNKRPGLDEFLRVASEKFELIAYTAAVEEYAKPLIDQLDPDNTLFRHRLYRSHCIFANGHYVKDLRVVNRPLDRVVLVDNNAYCFLPQLNNGIPISSFYNDHTDSALNVLQKFLHALHLEKDVQPMLREAFNLEKILKRDREQVLAGHPHFAT